MQHKVKPRCSTAGLNVLGVPWFYVHSARRGVHGAVATILQGHRAHGPPCKPRTTLIENGVAVQLTAAPSRSRSILIYHLTARPSVRDAQSSEFTHMIQ
eukprot:119494-Amphidinium_carterae.1